MTEVAEPKQINTDGNGTGTQPKDEGTPHGGVPAPNGKESSPPQKQPEVDPAAGRVVPSKYELKLPEKSTLSEAYVNDVVEFAKSHKLTNEEAQAILNREHDLQASIIQGQFEELEKSKEQWVASAQQDGEIGGDKFDENVKIAKRALDKFSTPAFINSLNETGLGNHPEVIRIFYRVGKYLMDDHVEFPGSESGKSERTLEDVFYGNSNKKENKE